MGYQNRFATKLASAIGASDTTITLKTVPIVTSGRLVLEPTNSTKFEIVKYTGIAGNTITGVTRGDGGTTAQTHAADSNVQMNVTAEDIQDLYDAFNSFSVAANDWRTLVGATTVVQQNGQRSVDMQTAGNVTAVLSKGMRVRLPRTGTAVQTQVTSLNGTNQYWNDTTVAGMTFTDDFVAGAWVKLSSYPTTQGVIISRYNGTSGWQLRIESTGQIGMLAMNAGAANYSSVTSYQSVPLNKWVYISAQLDMSAFTATTTTSYVMIDGVDVPTFVFRAGTNPIALVQAGNLEIGTANATAFFPGKIAQAFVSSAKITQANIRTFMNAPLTNALCTTHNIVSAYDFDSNGNDINTTNANNLTAQNGAVATNVDSPFNANAYGIIMNDPVYGGVNTTYNVQTPEGYPIPNATLGTVSYSGVKVPYGFPAQTTKWSVVMTKIVQEGVNIGSVNNFAASSTAITVPTGEWTILIQGGYKQNSTVSGTRSSFMALAAAAPASISASTFSPGTMTIARDVTFSNADGFGSLAGQFDVSLTVATTYRIYGAVDVASGSESFVVATNQHAVIITAENAYL